MKFLKDGERCLCELVAKFPLDVSTLSRHLKVLRDAGLILERREGVSKYFSLSNGKILTTLHRRKRGIRLRNARCGWMFHNGAGSVFVGAWTASQLTGRFLTVMFGVVILLGAIRMLTAKEVIARREKKLSVKTLVLWGSILGFFCGLVGIGGGALMVPVMVLILGFGMHEAVGTSTAIMIFTSSGGVISYILNGLNVADLPAFSLGYVNFLQWVCLALTSVPMAQLGVKMAHRIPAIILKRIFAFVMVYMSLKMMGIL
ncbi:MAG: TSUP family transporter [Thermotogae bacterium]|nr:TSUP family transporter [Thermotogota bacterium]